MTPRPLVTLIAADRHVAVFLARYLGLSNLLNKTKRSSHQVRDFTPESVRELWNLIGCNSAPVLSSVTLNRVALTEWVPISPSLAATFEGPDPRRQLGTAE